VNLSQLKVSEVIALCGVVPGLTMGDLTTLESGGAESLAVWPADKALLMGVGIYWLEKRREQKDLTFAAAMEMFDEKPPAADPPTPAPKKRTTAT